MHEHDGEPVPGLPQELPEGEHILWQGRSGFRSLALSTFHVRKLAIYFAALLGVRFVLQLGESASLLEVARGSAVLVALAAVAIGLLAWYARLASAASMFTITDRRVVMRCGVAVPVTVNLPFAVIDSADLRRHADGSGDIALQTSRSSRVSYILLWPMVKPFGWLKVRPVLRGLDEAEDVAGILSKALSAFAETDAAASQKDRDEEQSRAKRPFKLHAPLAGASALVVFAIVAVSFYQLAGGNSKAELEPAVAAVELWFQDREDGSVAVVDAESGVVIDVLDPGSNGFVRGALRSLARERRSFGFGDEAPFSIRQTESGRVVLHDPTTNRVIDLRAFGATNQAAFERFLALKKEGQIADNATSADTMAETGVTAVALTKQETRQ